MNIAIIGTGNVGGALAQQLAKDIGFSTCYDFGGDDKVELLEKFALQQQSKAIQFAL